ncbi:MAG: hypothetical protein LC104_16720 [Bacteroidales bacterium]|nr:hypothetical protein [Bacteroidales bacterium]
MDKKALKKHHFWILSGVAPALTLLAAILIWLFVGAAIAKQSEKIEAQEKLLSSTRGPGTKVLADYDAQTGELTKKKDELWKDNWERQATQYKLFTWPQDNDPRQRLMKLEKRYTKFGELIRDPDDALEVFKRKEVYEAAYDDEANLIKPTTFRGGNWRAVLRYVSNWGQKKPTSNQVWLALEDLWVQRGLLQPVKAVNDAAATFLPVPAPRGAEDPFHRVFRNKVWELELWIANNGTDKLIRAKLTNRTDRLQLLGIGNTMRLQVWLSDLPTAQPVDFRIEGEFVPAGVTIEPKPVARLHGIPPGMEKQKIARVRQILDSRTVPIRRVDNIVLGAKDDRILTMLTDGALKPPLFITEDPAAAGGGVAGGAPPGFGQPGGPGPAGPGAEAFAPPMLDPGMAGPGGLETPGAAQGKTGAPEVVLDKNKNRYVALTPQVRRMPFGVVVVVDQMFMQDVLVAYANSPLRCQITSFHWQRFRGSLRSTGTGTPGPGGLPGAENPYPSDENIESFTLPFAGATPGEEGGMFPGGPAGGPGFGSPGGASTVSEGQVTSGLVELAIYGIVSLYEKYEKPKPTDSADGADPTQPVAATDPMMSPAPMSPTPPMSPAPMSPTPPMPTVTPPTSVAPPMPTPPTGQAPAPTPPMGAVPPPATVTPQPAGTATPTPSVAPSPSTVGPKR